MRNSDSHARRRWLLGLFLLGCGMWPSGGLARESEAPARAFLLDEFVQRFESSYRRVQSLRAEFTQTYVVGGRRRVESGSVCFARGGLMRWDYRQPQEKVFLSDGKKLLLYVPEERQLTRTPIRASDDVRIPFRLLLSRLDLHRVFSRIEFADEAQEHDAGDRVLRAFPKRGYEEDYQEVLIELTPQFDVRRLWVVYPDHSTMEFKFDRLQRNAEVRRSLFRFVPPEGTEIIDQR
jgi:outer membrane lipoprotein carrier protein